MQIAELGEDGIEAAREGAPGEREIDPKLGETRDAPEVGIVARFRDEACAHGLDRACDRSPASGGCRRRARAPPPFDSTRDRRAGRRRRRAPALRRVRSGASSAGSRRFPGASGAPRPRSAQAASTPSRTGSRARWSERDREPVRACATRKRSRRAPGRARLRMARGAGRQPGWRHRPRPTQHARAGCRAARPLAATRCRRSPRARARTTPSPRCDRRPHRMRDRTLRPRRRACTRRTRIAPRDGGASRAVPGRRPSGTCIARRSSEARAPARRARLSPANSSTGEGCGRCASATLRANASRDRRSTGMPPTYCHRGRRPPRAPRRRRR